MTQLTRTGNSGSTDIYCETCGQKNRADRHICFRCGTAFVNYPCPECGAEIHAGERVCSNCGSDRAPGMSPAAVRGNQDRRAQAGLSWPETAKQASIATAELGTQPVLTPADQKAISRAVSRAISLWVATIGFWYIAASVVGAVIWLLWEDPIAAICIAAGGVVAVLPAMFFYAWLEDLVLR
jgi:hypothetical protein